MIESSLAGDEIHLYVVLATNLLLVRRAKRSHPSYDNPAGIGFFSHGVLVLEIFFCGGILGTLRVYHGWQVHGEGIVAGVLSRVILRAREEQVMYSEGVYNDWTVGWPQDTGVGRVFNTDYIPCIPISTLL